MAATPTALDDLLALLSPEEQAVVKLTILKNDKARAALEEGLEFRKTYLDGTDDAAAQAAAKAAAAADAEAEAARVAAARAAANGTVTPPAASADTSAILKQLSDLSNSLTGKLGAIEKEMVKKSEVNAFRGEILSSAIKNADLVMQLRAQHKEEFPDEPFDPDKIQAYLDAEANKGRRFPDIRAVYNEMYGEKRTEVKIAKGIAEGLKAKKSGQGAEIASGGSGAVALSPAQEAMRKMRGEGGAQDHVVSMADKLRRIREAREAREGGIEEAS